MSTTDTTASETPLTDTERAALFDTLTPEEKQAITDGKAEDEAERLASEAQKAAGDDDDDAAAPAAAPAAAAPPAAPAPAPAAPAPAPAAAAPAADATAAAPAAAAAPAEAPPEVPAFDVPILPTYELPKTDFQAELGKFDTQETEVQAKFEAGDIDAKDLAAELRRINTERSGVLAQQSEAATMTRINESNVKANNAAFERAFIRHVAKDGVDYTKPSNGKLFNVMLDEVFEEHKDYTREQAWAAAHIRTAAARGITLGKASAAPSPAAAPAPAGAPPAAPAPPSRKMDLAAAPKTLAHVAGSDGADAIQADEFAHLDALEGLALESALHKLTQEQRDRYLAG